MDAMTDNQARVGAALPDDILYTNARTFRDAGYVVLEDVYTTDWVAGVRAAYDALAARYVADRGGLEALAGKTFGLNHLGIYPAVLPPWSDPQIVAHPLIDAHVTELLGPDYCCGFYNINAAYPGSGVQPAHRDSSPLFPGTEMSVPHPAASLVLNVPLCDFTVENGSTEVWPGSHLIVDRTPEDAKSVEARAAHLLSERTNVRAGSVILRDLRMFHRGMPNLSDQVRPMIAIVFVRAFHATDGLDIPQSTWDAWPERARQIFRANRLVPDTPSAARYRL